MTKLDAYVFFDGNCAEAMRFYESVLRGKLEILMTVGEAPEAEKTNPADKDKIVHGHLVFESGSLLASDWLAPAPYPGKHGFSLSLHPSSMEEGQRLFAELSNGGMVTLPFDKTFWAAGFGMAIDRFGTHWMFNATLSE